MVFREPLLSFRVRISFSYRNWPILPSARVWRGWRELLALRWAASLAVGLIGGLIHWACLSGSSSYGKSVRERMKLVRMAQFISLHGTGPIYALTCSLPAIDIR